jgi:hypothetical protein
VRLLPSRVRSALLTRLDGLPSDELFTIPATRTASVYVESSTGSRNLRRSSVRAGNNHDTNPTSQPPALPDTTRKNPR